MNYKIIPEYSNYIVFKTGKVYSKKSGIFLKPSNDRGGYKKVRLSQNGKQFNVKLHRLVALVFLTNPDNKSEVDHINRQRDDNRVENLKWVSSSENKLNRCVPKHNKLKQKNISIGSKKRPDGKIDCFYRLCIIRNRKVVVEKQYSMKKYDLEYVIQERDKELSKINN